LPCRRSPHRTGGPCTPAWAATNKPFGRWGETFGDETVAAAMIDRLVHHAEVHSLKGESYRMRGRELGRTSTTSNN
jgi:DNA replication protein DnaC